MNNIKGLTSKMINNNNPMINKDIRVHIVESGVFLRNVQNGRTYHMGKVEYDILMTFDGKHTLDELKKINAKYLSDKQFEEFVFFVNTNDLLEREDKPKKKFDILKIRKPLCCPMKFLHKGITMSVLKASLIMGSIASMVTLIWFLSTRAGLVFQTLFTNDYLQAKNIVYYFISIFILGFFHEMGHAIMIVASGGNVFELGVMLNCFHPAFYVDITGVDHIKSKMSRILVWLAGIMMEVIIALPAMIVTFYEKSPFFLNEFLVIFNILNTTMMIFNLLFMIKLDGYYVLSELLEIQGLREKSVSYILNGYNQGKDNSIKLEDKLILTVVGLISVVYLPLFVMQMVITGVNHFIPRILPVVSNVMLVWMAVAVLFISVRKISTYKKGR